MASSSTAPAHSSSSNEPPTGFWLKHEVFEHALLNSPIKWTDTSVMRLSDYLKQRDENRMKITKEQWLELMKKDLRSVPKVQEELALSYWQIFEIMYATLYTGALKETFDVRVLSIFMMCQVFLSSSASRGEFDEVRGMDGIRPSPRMNSPRISPRAAQMTNNINNNYEKGATSKLRQKFVVDNLPIFLYVISADPQGKDVTRSDFECLRFLFGHGPRSNMLLSQACTGIKWQASDRGGDKNSATAVVNKNDLSAIIKENLEVNRMRYPELDKTTHFGLTAVHHKHSDGALGSTAPDPRLQMVPQNRNWNVIANISRSTTVDPTQSNRVYVNDCDNAYIYLTERMNSLYIANCRNVTIFCHHAKICTLVQCERVSLHLLCDFVKLDNCIDCTCYVATKLPPLVCGDSRGLKLAPLNVARDHKKLLEENPDLARDYATKWSQPICSNLQMSHQFVNPRHFTILTPPGYFKGRDLLLPPVYEEAIKAANRNIESKKEKINEASREAQLRIYQEFERWLTKTKKIGQLNDLTKLGMHFKNVGLAKN